MQKSIRVGAIDYRVIVEDAPLLDGVKVDGLHKWGVSEIHLRKMLPQAMKQTLWHEVVHALCAQYSIEMEEKDVDRMATGIMQVIRDNLWITK